jgi:hypothetical protein
MKRLLTCYYLILFVPAVVLSQNMLVESEQNKHSLIGGGNYTTLLFKGDALSPSLRPFLGYSIQQQLNSTVFFNYSFLFSRSASQLLSVIDLEQTGFQLQTFPQFKFDDFFINTGFTLELITKRKYREKGDFRMFSLPADTVDALRGYFTFGTEFKLVEKASFFINYHIPLLNQGDKNLQAGVRIPLSVLRDMPRVSRRKKAAYERIDKLKKGVLLVRLHTSEPKISAMQKAGVKQKRIQQAMDNQREQNIALMGALKRNYNFSELRFFL